MKTITIPVFGTVMDALKQNYAIQREEEHFDVFVALQRCEINKQIFEQGELIHKRINESGRKAKELRHRLYLIDIIKELGGYKY